jgi:hypothetical protein
MYQEFKTAYSERMTELEAEEDSREAEEYTFSA